jgi:hypothetical protein
MTWRSAAVLPARPIFKESSIRHTVLTGLIYKTMTLVQPPRQIAVICWAEGDYEAAAVSAGLGSVRKNGVETSGFYLRRQPRLLHLAPWVCSKVQQLLNARQGNAHQAISLATGLHEAIHAHGLANEAQTNCYAVQLVEPLARHAGVKRKHASYLQKLALNGVRSRAPAGYWNNSKCREGGAWDLLPTTRNL